MKKALFPLIILVLFSSCSTNKKPLNTYESDTLKVQPIGNGVFAHVSYLETKDFGKVGCNGMFYFNKGEAIVFDTPADGNASKELINWIKKVHKKSIKAVVATHFHKDCLGGLEQFHDNETRSYASNATIELAQRDNIKVLPQIGFENNMEFKVGEKSVFAKFFGEGHTADNIVGYIPEENALFGGCLVKSIGAGKGNLGDASVSEWSSTVEKIKIEFPDLKIVVPGHGKSGGTALLDHTIQLFKHH